VVKLVAKHNNYTTYVAVPAGCSVDPVNYFGSEHITPMLRPNKRGRETEDISRQQKLQISLNYNACQDEADRSASIPNPNIVSTGLRLSYDDDERNSSVTSASGSMTAAPSIILSLGDNITTELDRQKEEFDQYIKIQVLQPSSKHINKCPANFCIDIASLLGASSNESVRQDSPFFFFFFSFFFFFWGGGGTV